MASASGRSRWLVLLGVIGTSAWLVRCGSSADEAPPAGPQGGMVGDADQGTSESSPDVLEVPDGSGGSLFHEACGVLPDSDPRHCVPDQPLSCALHAASQGGASGAEGGVSNGGAGGANQGGAGQGGASGAESGGAGGVTDSSGGVDGAGQGGVPPIASGGATDVPQGGASGAAGSAGSGVSTPDYSCQVTVTSDGPLAECKLAGSGLAGDPCFSSGECAPGLACVVTLSGIDAATCRPFCCGGDSYCSQGSYCDERELKGAPGTVIEVPVCVPARPCSLTEPYPCDAGSCTCDPGEACLVVRADGTTTCAEPGTGEVGDPCPCAWGHVCSASNQCVLMCETARAEHYCGNAKCQASAELPEGWGVCVGAAPDASAR